MEKGRTAKWNMLSGNALKWIAVITMLTDHVGAMIIEPGILSDHIAGIAVEFGSLIKYDLEAVMGSEVLARWFVVDMVLRAVGRIAFPIFCFLLVEGFLHTRDVKKYALRLLAFCFLSEIPFNLGLSGRVFYPEHQNVFFTLFLGLAALIGIRKAGESVWKQAMIFFACSGAAVLLCTDYDAFGVFFIVLLYLLRDDKKMRTILGCVGVCWKPAAMLAFIPINMYNGTRGAWNLKYLFYMFYPVHILALWGIRMALPG